MDHQHEKMTAIYAKIGDAVVGSDMAQKYKDMLKGMLWDAQFKLDHQKTMGKIS